ncbi:MAG: methyltransferase domain-containing protein [Candidatus Latescibacterota bacterium]
MHACKQIRERWIVALCWIMILFASIIPVSVRAQAKSADKPLGSYEEMENEFTGAYESKDFSAALEIAEKMADLTYPKHIAALYKTAAMHCLLGHKEHAYQWVRWTLEAGFWDYRRLLADEDFTLIREEERFTNLVTKTRIQRYLEMLERPEREEFQKPAEVMAALALRPGERVADIGAGSGYFTIPVAKAVGASGTVWAIDIRQEMLDYIEGRLAEEKLDNVKLLLVEKDDPRLPAGGIDTILLIDTWHYIRDPEYAKKLSAGLAPGGRVVIIDYKPKAWEDRPWGPPPQQQTSREELDEHFAQAGLQPIKVHDFLTEQYFVEYGNK